MQETGRLITFEGPDGAGKTTQVALTAAALRQEGYEVLVTREPGGTRLAEAIRMLLLDPAFGKMTPLTEALLYAAARAQLVAEVLRPALKAGRVVLCDRFVDSSLAYQGYGRGLDLALLRRINAPALEGIGRFLTILLDVEPEEGLRRGAHPGPRDRLEQEELAFHRRVREGYLELARRGPERIRLVRGGQSPAAVQEEVLGVVRAYLQGKFPGAPFVGEVEP